MRVTNIVQTREVTKKLSVHPQPVRQNKLLTARTARPRSIYWPRMQTSASPPNIEVARSEKICAPNTYHAHPYSADQRSEILKGGANQTLRLRCRKVTLPADLNCTGVHFHISLQRFSNLRRVARQSAQVSSRAGVLFGTVPCWSRARTTLLDLEILASHR